MRTRYFILMTSILVFTLHVTYGREQILYPGDKFLSPNGLFVAIVRENTEHDIYLEVNKRQNNQKMISIGIESNPLHAIAWSGDSSTVLLVEQAAEGTFAGMIHFDGRRWTKTDLFPTETDDNFSLLGWHVGGKSLHLLYLIYAEKGRDEKGARKYVVFRCAYDVDLSTRSVSNYNKSALSDDEIVKIKKEFSASSGW